MQNQIVRVTVAGLMATVGIFSMAQAATPSGSGGPMPRQLMKGQHQPAAAVSRKLLYALQNWGQTVNVGAGGTVPIDKSTKFKCQVASCTIVANTAVQAFAISTPGRWAVCSYVDGDLMNNSCIYQGVVGVDFVVGTNRANYSVTAGAHQIRTFIYMEAAGGVNAYQLDYEVYTP